MPTDGRHPAQATADSTDAMWRVTQQSLADAEQYVDAGSRVPPMRTMSALTRAIATPFVGLRPRAARRPGTAVVQSGDGAHVYAITEATRSELQAIRARPTRPGRAGDPRERSDRHRERERRHGRGSSTSFTRTGPRSTDTATSA
jgi:hypothetical protein